MNTKGPTSAPRTNIGAGVPDAPLDGSSPAAAPKRPGPAAFPVFYINRDCDVHRRTWIENGLSKVGVEAERVRGVEGLVLPEHFRSYFFEADRLVSRLKPGEVGCYASHLAVMKIVVERGLDYALVLEDDAVLPLNLAEKVQDILAALPPGWDLVHLCKDPSRAVKPIAVLKQGGRLVRYSRIPDTATGYLISYAGASKFLVPVQRYWPIDTDFRQPWRFGLEVYGVVPKLITDNELALGSSIHDIGGHSRLRRGIPIPSRHCWTGNPLHTPQGMLFNMRTLGTLSWALCTLQNVSRRAASMLGSDSLRRRFSSALSANRNPA